MGVLGIIERPIRVVIVDDHEVVRVGILAMLEREPDIQVTGSFRTAEEAVRSMASTAPDVVLLDHPLQGMRGAAACTEILRARRNAAVTLLTTVVEDAVIHSCLVAGARGYLLKGCHGQELVSAIRALARGETVLAPDIVSRVVDWARRAKTIHGTGFSLTPREVAVLSFAAQGLINRDIARRLCVSEGSVKLSMRTTMRKLGVSERAQAVVAGIRRGVI